MPTLELNEVAFTLANTDTAKATKAVTKKIARQIDLINAIAMKRKKHAKDADDTTKAEINALVENSRKKPMKQEELPLGDEDTDTDTDADAEELVTYEAQTRAELVKEATARNITFKKSATKAALVQLLLDDDAVKDADEQNDEDNKVDSTPTEEETEAAEWEEELADLTVKELNKELKDRKIKVEKDWTRENKIAMLVFKETGVALADLPKPKKAEAKTPKKPDTETQRMKELEAQLKALKSENNKLKAKLFPETYTSPTGKELVATKYEGKTADKIRAIQQQLVATPYEMYALVHEGLDDVATTMQVVYMNESIIILVDKSREVNSTLTLLVPHMTRSAFKIDGRNCPYMFYVPQDEEEDDNEE